MSSCNLTLYIVKLITMKNRSFFRRNKKYTDPIVITLAILIYTIIGSDTQAAFTQGTTTIRCLNSLPEIALSWTIEDGALYYRVQRKNLSNTPWDTILDSQIKDLSYVDILWKSDYGATTYFYRIEAIKNTGSVFSNEIAVSIPECRNKPTPPPVPTPTPTATPVPTKFVKDDRVIVRRVSLNVRTAPSIGAQVLGTQPAGSLATVIAGPVYDSVNNYWFWQLNYGSGVDGWSVEYWLDKIPPVPTPTPTATPVPTKFVKDDRVIVRRVSLNVRTAPSIGAQVLGTQPAGSLATVIAGPVYDSVNNYWFWQLNYGSGVDGWSVEYWLDKIPPVPTPTPTATPITTPGKIPSTMKWGVYTGWQNSSMTEFETLTKKKPQMEMVFVHWGNETQFPLYYAPRIRDQGRTMVLFWEASDFKRDPFNQPEFSYDAVLAGKLDNYFRTFAEGAKSYAGPIILIPYSEFNGNWNGWSVTIGNNTPDKHIAAYRRIHSFFTNVPNVKFGWAPNSNAVPNTPSNRMELSYPGDAYVDYVGVDGFNFGGNQEYTFTQVFGDILTRLKQYKKPIYIFSTASAAGPNKAAWIKDALTVQLYKYPEVAGWLWFNQNKERDWRILTHCN